MYIGKQIPEYLLSKLSITDKSASLYWRDAAKQFSFSASGEPTNFAKLGPRGQYGSIKQLAHTTFQYPICRLGRKYKYFDRLLLSGVRITRSQKVLLEQGMLSHIFILSLCLQELDGFEDATYQCVIGDGMRRTPGIAGRTFTALGKNKINIEMISQGASEINITFIVDSKDAEHTVQVLHEEYYGE